MILILLPFLGLAKYPLPHIEFDYYIEDLINGYGDLYSRPLTSKSYFKI